MDDLPPPPPTGGTGPFVLERPRGAGEIVLDGLRIWFRHPGLFLLIGAAIAVPVELLIPGLLGGRLLDRYDIDAPISQSAPGPTNIVFALFVTPATAAASVAVLMGVSSGRTPRVGEALRFAFQRFGDAVGPIVLAGLGTLLGLLLLIAPGVYLYVRWYLTVQTVVVERTRGSDALRRSSELVAGRWWATFGRVLLITLVCVVPFFLFIGLGVVAGLATGYDAAALACEAVGDVFFFPLIGLMTTLVYFDLRARGAATIGEKAPSPAGP